MNNHLVYLVFGKDVFIYEAIYSILSFYKINGSDLTKIHIFTDNSKLFENHLQLSNIFFHELDKNKIEHWKGKNNYVYRLKIKCLLEISNSYTGNFLFVDADTVFRENFNLVFNKIEKGTLVMNFNEGKISTKKTIHFKQYYKYFKKNNQKIFSETANAKEALNCEMWNSGIIGFNNQNRVLLQNALEFCDILLEEINIRTIEQFVISYYFQQNKLIDVNNEIFHYWYFKGFGDIAFNFFKKYKNLKMTEKIQKMANIDPEFISKEIITYKEMSFFQKIIKKIESKKKWELKPYKI